MSRDRTLPALAIACALLLAAAALAPQWLVFLLALALAKGLVVLGLVLLMRTGLVSFGQGLFYCLGAYAAGALGKVFGISDVFLLLVSGAAAAALLAYILGFLVAQYRDIFFAMLSMAFSMILYGLLVKTAALGSSDGFNVPVPTLFGAKLVEASTRYMVFAVACAATILVALGVHWYQKTTLGSLSPAIKDNELRVEYMGASVRHAIHVKFVIAAALAGLGGALTGMTVGHIDPEMAYWTTSGEFVFVTILSGTGSVVAPFLGSLIFETIRSYAYEYSPNTWQMVLGTSMLLVIVFLPAGMWSIFASRRKRV